MTTERIKVSAFIFDMDGTLTVPVLDFAAIRAEIGVPSGNDLLVQIEAMDPADRRRAHAVIERHEADAARAAELNPGAAELLEHLADRGVKMALLTRNSRASVAAFGEQFGFAFDATHTREDGVTKPSPEPVLHLCREMNTAPADTLMVGDFLFDILSGRAAGAPTCLITHGQTPAWLAEAAPDLVIESMAELLEKVEITPSPSDRMNEN